jgi:hypothetical protein
MFEDPNIRQIDFYQFNETIINPVALGLTALMCLFIFFVKKRAYAIVPMLIVALYITNRQRLVIGGLDFDMLRIIVVFGLIRVLLQSENRNFKFIPIDKVMVWFSILGIITFTIQRGGFDAFINRLGFAFDIFGLYFLVKIFISNFEDIDRIVKMIVILSAPIAIAMIAEQITGRNFFSIFGGVPEINVVRDGNLRSQGAFSHAILAGSFGASLLPLSWGLWNQNKASKPIALVGFLSAAIITITCSSSGPILSFIAGFWGILFWILRKHTRIVQILTVIGILVLHIFMKIFIGDPVWAILYRITIVSGSTGWHRYNLIQQSINRFAEWALVGTKSSAHWGWGLQDVTNMYIRIGINGGFISLILFVVTIFFAFRGLGISIKRFENHPYLQKYIWAIGVSIFTHTISFTGVSYFGQMIMFWYMSLAIAASISQFSLIQFKSYIMKYYRDVYSKISFPISNPQTNPIRQIGASFE